MKQLKPLAVYEHIEPLDEEETTASGLIMPEKAKEKPAKGKVIEVGGKMRKEWMYPSSGPVEVMFPIESPVKKGQVVVFHRWSGQDVKEGQKEYKLVKFSDLMGVYE